MWDQAVEQTSGYASNAFLWVIYTDICLCFVQQHCFKQRVWIGGARPGEEEVYEFTLVQVSFNQCWSGIVLFDTIQVSIMRDFTFFIPIGYGYLTVFLLSIPFGCIYHARTFIPYTTSSLVSIWFRMVLTQIIISEYKDCCTLTYPPNINIWLVVQFQRPRDRFFYTIIDVDSSYLCIHMYTSPTLIQSLILGQILIASKRICLHMSKWSNRAKNEDL